MTALAVARAHVLAAAGPEAPRRRILSFIDAHDDALLRSCADGHLTGSAVLVDAAGERAALLHHRKIGRWLQPGGHADGDGDLAAVAVREAEEETGIAGAVVLPAVDLDVHAIAARPGEPAHVHLDVRFVVRAPAGAALVGNHESTALRWVALDELDDPALALDASTRRLLRAGLAVARGA